MADTPQSAANHAKFVPLYHFVLTGILVVNLLWSGWNLFKNFGFSTAWGVVMALALIGLFLYARLFALQAQDRVIRLEEHLRMERLLADDLKSRVGELRRRQIIGLRFASDDELSDRVREALTENLSEKDIKLRIKSWRPDHHRL